MPLSAGDKLGPYDVIAAIGAGGMGEVYKARDTRLDRTVAIKVLPEHIAQREDARARFDREARAVASLNHPNICTLHDIGPNYMVMELIEGETLAARIEKGPISLDQAISLATQIADALDRAHRAGVTHRDVKPQNIMLTRDGVKVLDFGLAKSQARPGPTEETLTAVLTTEGTIMGTPQYMAPEQFEGKEADARSDIWAFGAVLYEMTTGQKTFQGKSYTSLVAAILGGEPAPMAVKPFTPTWLERLVRRCLQKDPEDRWQTMRDVVIELKSPPVEPEAISAKPSRWWRAIASAATLASVLFAGLWLRNRAASPLPPLALEVSMPNGGDFRTNASTDGLAISPDGKTLAFAAPAENGQSLLFVRPLDSLAARSLPGTESASIPFWTPDSKSLAFATPGKLKRIDLTSGVSITLLDLTAGASANLLNQATTSRGVVNIAGDCNEDGVILIGGRSGIVRIQDSAGPPVAVTRVNRELRESSHRHPQFLPGGREFLYFVRHRDSSKSGIAIGSLDTKADESGSAAILVQTGYSARFDAASSMLLYIQGTGTLMARRLELHPAKLVGEPMVVAEGVQTIAGRNYGTFSLSRGGLLAYAKAPQSGKMRFGWRDRAGKSLEVIGDPVEASGLFALSPDGTRVAYNAGPAGFARSGNFRESDVWVMDLASGLSTRISFNKGNHPRWSPDGRFLYYLSPKGVVRKPGDGSGEEVLLANPATSDYLTSVSPDGKALLFAGQDILTMPLAAGGPTGAKPETYLNTGHQNRWAVFSPDGRWVAYDSLESGIREVFIQGYPDKRGKWLVATGGFPSWRQDGKELYWYGTNAMLTAAAIELRPDGVRPGRPEPLFQLPVPGSFTMAFQPSRDGQRFLVYEPVSAASESGGMVVIQNWARKLEK